MILVGDHPGWFKCRSSALERSFVDPQYQPHLHDHRNTYFFSGMAYEFLSVRSQVVAGPEDTSSSYRNMIGVVESLSSRRNTCATLHDMVQKQLSQTPVRPFACCGLWHVLHELMQRHGRIPRGDGNPYLTRTAKCGHSSPAEGRPNGPYRCLVPSGFFHGAVVYLVRLFSSGRVPCLSVVSQSEAWTDIDVSARVGAYVLFMTRMMMVTMQVICAWSKRTRCDWRSLPIGFGQPGFSATVAGLIHVQACPLW